MTKAEAARLNGQRGGRPAKAGETHGETKETQAGNPAETQAVGYLGVETQGGNPSGGLLETQETQEESETQGDAELVPVPEPERICWPPGKRVPCWLGSEAWVQAYLSRPTVDMRSLAVEAEVPAAREPERHAGR